MQSMITGNPIKQIVLFAIPLVIGNLFQQIYALVDMFIVGRLLGVDSLAAVGAMVPVFVMIILITAGFTRGLVIITAQRFGAGDTAGVRRSFATGLVLCTVFSVIAVSTLICYLPAILHHMQVPANIYDLSLKFMRILGCSLFATVYYNYLSGVMQSLGDSKTPLYFLIFSCVLNAILNWFFIGYVEMDVRGSALGTAMAQAISAVLCLAYMMRHFPILRTTASDWVLTGKAVWSHLRLAIPLGVQFSVIGLGMIVTQRACNAFGSDVIAAFAAASRVEHLATIPLFTLGMAMTTFVAQNFGARQIDRIRQSVFQCTFLSFVLSVVAGIIVFVWGKNVVLLFIDSPTREIMAAAEVYLQLSVLFYFFQGQIFVFRQTLSGMGYAVLPFIAGVTELVMRAFAAVVLVGMWGYLGICYSGPVSWIGGAVVAGVGYVWLMRYHKKIGRNAYEYQ